MGCCHSKADAKRSSDGGDGGGAHHGGGDKSKQVAFVDADAEAAARILGPGGGLPEVALAFVESRASTDDNPGGELRRQYRDATAWVLEALCLAYADPEVKGAARRLLANADFCRNLDAYDRPWRTTLRPALRARLVELGVGLKADFDRRGLGRALSDAAVNAAVGRPEDHPLAKALAARGATGRGPTQIDVLPCAAPVDFSRLWEYPEEVYSHALLLLAAAANAAFQKRVAAVVKRHNATYNGGRGTAKHSAAPPKAPARVKTKAASDYRYREKPVGQNNIDVVRCLVSADTPEELLSVATALTEAFGGAVKVKNLFAAGEADRADRFYLLPLMLTVAVDGGGVTFGEYVRQPAVRAAFDKYISRRDPGVPKHKWAETTKAAVAMLESPALSGVHVGVLGELQLVLTAHAGVRHKMHEVYKAYRAESAELLFDDFTRTVALDEADAGSGGGERGDGGEGNGEDGGGDDGGGDDDDDDIHDDGGGRRLWLAAARGERPAVQRILAFVTGVDVDCVETSGRSTPLFVASQIGWTDVVKALADAGADANKPADDAEGATPVYIASQNGHVDIVSLLLGAGADAGRRTGGSGWTPLVAASQRGYRDVAGLLLGAGADVDADAPQGSGYTALLAAVQEGERETVDVLLAAGANPNVAAADTGLTPLFCAAQAGSAAMARALVDAGAGVDAATKDSGCTPLFIASQLGHESVVRVLLGGGANVEALASQTGSTPLFAAAHEGHAGVVFALCGKGADVRRTLFGNGCTALHVAAERGHAGVVDVLISSGADANAAMTDAAAFAPLHRAAANGHDGAVRALLHAGADANAATADAGWTPLLFAAESGHEGVTRALLDAGAMPDVASTDEDRVTPLFVAAQHGHAGVVRALLSGGVSAGVASGGGATPLHVAAQCGHEGVVAALLDACADAGCGVGGSGATPLVLASRAGHAPVVSTLLTPPRVGAEMAGLGRAASETGGYTALFAAALEGHGGVVRVLLDAGADANAPAANGGTPLAAALHGRHDDVAEMLRAAGAKDERVHPAASCDGLECGCEAGGAIAGRRWHRVGDDFDLCDKAFGLLPEGDKARFELIDGPGADPVPHAAVE